MSLLNALPGAKPQSVRRSPRRRPRVDAGEVRVVPLIVSVGTLLAIAWLVAFQHQHSSLYDNVPHPDRPAAVAIVSR